MTGLPIPRPDLEKLAKLCALLTSDRDGEVLAAAHKASSLLRRHGLTWHQVIEAAARQADPPPIEPQWRLLRRQCLARPDLLTEWELAFLARIGRQTRISPRQLEVLERLAAELQEAAR